MYVENCNKCLRNRNQPDFQFLYKLIIGHFILRILKNFTTISKYNSKIAFFTHFFQEISQTLATFTIWLFACHRGDKAQAMNTIVGYCNNPPHSDCDKVLNNVLKTRSIFLSHRSEKDSFVSVLNTHFPGVQTQLVLHSRLIKPKVSLRINCKRNYLLEFVQLNFINVLVFMQFNFMKLFELVYVNFIK